MLARQNVYNLLRCFFLQEPTAEFLGALKEEDLLKNLRGYHPDLDQGVELISCVLSSPALRGQLPELKLEFTRLFIGPAPVPLYESVYRSPSGLMMQEETCAVRRVYRSAGLVAHPRSPFPEDHIGAELEFIYFLCRRAAETRESEARQALLKVQHGFFQDHLVCWVAALCDRLQEETECPYFRGVAKMTKGFVLWDYEEIVSHFLE